MTVSIEYKGTLYVFQHTQPVTTASGLTLVRLKEGNLRVFPSTDTKLVDVVA